MTDRTDLDRLLAEGQPVAVRKRTRREPRRDTLEAARRWSLMLGCLSGVAVMAAVSFVGVLLIESGHEPRLSAWLMGVAVAALTMVVVTWYQYEREAGFWEARNVDEQETIIQRPKEDTQHPIEQVTPRQYRRVQTVNGAELAAIASKLLTADGLLREHRLTRAQVRDVMTNYTERYRPLIEELHSLGWLDAQNQWTPAGRERLRYWAGFRPRPAAPSE